jgi:hypothetical protein
MGLRVEAFQQPAQILRPVLGRSNETTRFHNREPASSAQMRRIYGSPGLTAALKPPLDSINCSTAARRPRI